MAQIELDLSNWPAVVVRPPVGEVTDAEMESFLERFFQEVEARGGRYVLVNDLRQNTGITARQRKMIVESMERTEASRTAVQVGNGMVFSSTLLRGMLTAIFWMRKPRYETRTFGDCDEAIEWAQGVVRDESKLASGE